LNYAKGFIHNLNKEWPHLLLDSGDWFQKLVFPEGIPYNGNAEFGIAILGMIFNLNQVFLRDKSLPKSSGSSQDSVGTILLKNSRNGKG